MRVKRGIHRHRRRKKLLGLAKGYEGLRHKIHRKASEAVKRAGKHAYRDRRKKKRDFRALWIVRLTAALRAQNIRYSVFMNDLKKKKVELNRKVLSELAVREPEVFQAVVEKVRA